MALKIHKQTVNDLLWTVLKDLMDYDSLARFRLVGGTALSLQLGHRKSIDIDLFTDATYASIDFNSILKQLKIKYDYVDHGIWINDAPGNSCFIGANSSEAVKLDLFYAEPFSFPIIQFENIRLASLEEVATMKLDVIGRGGRKKDFWDIHALLDHLNLDKMINFYLQKYPYHHSTTELVSQLTNFDKAEHDPDPICLKGKYWELVKLDIQEAVKMM